MSAAVILAGGKSRRMGRDKLGLTIGGRTLLESAVIRFAAEFDDVYISVADAEKYPEIDARRVVDVHPGAGPLSGLHAALTTIPEDGVFLVAADLPDSSPRAAMRMIELCGGADACVIKQPDGLLEPLFGYYKKTLLRRCEDMLLSGERRMTELLSMSDTRYVSPTELGGLWDERMLRNINYPADYEKILNECAALE